MAGKGAAALRVVAWPVAQSQSPGAEQIEQGVAIQPSEDSNALTSPIHLKAIT
jgi:hypothetical protein